MESFNCFIRVAKPPNLFFHHDANVSVSTKFPISNPKSHLRVRNHAGDGTGASSVSHRIRVSDALRASDDVTSSEAGSTVPVECDKTKISEELRKEMEETLEWGLICSQLSAFVSTSAGRDLCRRASLLVGRDRWESEKLLDQTGAAAELPEPLDFSGIDDVSGIVRSAASGALLTIRELCAVEGTLRGGRRVFEQLERISAASSDSANRYAPLVHILQDCDFLRELANKIGFCIDCTLSIVLDQASTRLQSIRLERRKNMENLESLLKDVSVKIFQVGGIDSPLITKRRSRMCIGIKASYKSLLPEGVVLSSSSSGATYFMEPRDAIELNNMEVRLFNEEKAEELAILTLLTSEVAIAETKVSHLMEKILELDLAVARGAYALWMTGVRPCFNPDYEGFKPNLTGNSFLSVDIRSIQHPLLLESSLVSLSSVSVKEGGISNLFNWRDRERSYTVLPEGKAPVPIDIKIKVATKVVVISGPNTGGKTATMKTLGLASLMSKAGMFLPAKEKPKLPWFDQILADIGDHQSLEHNLSTFSGHISRLRKIIEVTSEDSLVLIDEIGSGTDPSEGVALSTSILQHLAGNVNLAIVTTHYADLSCLKGNDSRFDNAAMEFCLETLQPTYHVLWGSRGNSNALNIAKSIGFDQKVLHRAEEWVKNLVPDKQSERQGLLYQSLMEERNLLEVQANESATVLAEAMKLHHEIQTEAGDLDKRVEVLKAKESHIVQQELKNIKSQMDYVIKNFENQLQGATLNQLTSILRESEAAISSIVSAHRPTDDMLGEARKDKNTYLPQVGDKVHVKGLGEKVATVVEAPGNDGITLVQYGKVKVRVKRTDMKLIQRSVTNAETGAASQIKPKVQRMDLGSPLEGNQDESASFGPVVKTSKNTVDLRGMRIEEASHRLQMAISGSRPYGVLFVVHGMGTGAVKECALDILRKHPRVAKFEEESPMNYGCTIAYIK